jgi:hypothetical protein
MVNIFKIFISQTKYELSINLLPNMKDSFFHRGAGRPLRGKPEGAPETAGKGLPGKRRLV